MIGNFQVRTDPSLEVNTIFFGTKLHTKTLENALN